MDSKEKAKELIGKYAIKLPTKYNNIVDDIKIWDYNIGLAKQCALIAVDEILNGSRLFYIEDYNYWKEVKQEIEKL